MAAGKKRPNLQTGAARRHSLDQKVAVGSLLTAVLAQQFHHVLAFVVRRYL